MRLPGRPEAAPEPRRGKSPAGGGGVSRRLIAVTGCTLVTQACTFLLIFLLTRSLTPAAYGVFVWAVTVQSYLFLVGTAGIKQTLVRELLRRPADLGALFSAHHLITGSGGTLLACLCVALLVGGDFSGTEQVVLTLLVFGNIPVCLNLLPFYDAWDRQTLSALLVLVLEVLGLGAAVVLYRLGALTLPTVALLLAVKWGVNCGLHHAVARSRLPSFALVPGLRATPGLLRSSWPLLLGSVLATVPFSAGIFFVRNFCGPAETALLGLGTQAATAYLFLMTAAVRLLQRWVCLIEPQQTRQAMAVFLRFAGFQFLVWAGATLAAWGAILWLLGPGYEGAVFPTLLMLLAAFVYGNGLALASYLVAARKETHLLLAHGAAACLYLTGCWLVVARYGAVGAATLSLLAAFSYTAMLLLSLLPRSASRSGFPA